MRRDVPHETHIEEISSLGSSLQELTLTALVAVVVAFAFGGCSTTRTVTVQPEDRTLQTTLPDTTKLDALPLAERERPRGGSVTQPLDVTIYDDTASATLPVSLLDVDRTDPDDQTITFRFESAGETVEKTFRLPRIGERLRATPDAETTAKEATGEANAGEGTPSEEIPATPNFRALLYGEPIEYDVEADVSEVPDPWYERFGRWLRLLAAIGFGIFVGYALTKLVPGL